MPNALNRAWMVGRGRRRVPGDGRWQDGGKFGLMTPWVSPRPCLARGTARGAKLAQFFDPELVADRFRGIALHLTQALFEDGGHLFSGYIGTLIKTWVAQLIIISVLFVGTVLAQKRFDMR